MNKMIIFLICFLVIFFVAGCEKEKTAEEIIEPLLSIENEVKPLYAEGKYKIFEKDELIGEVEFHEYVDKNGRKKIIEFDKKVGTESLTINNGEQAIVHAVGSKLAKQYEIADDNDTFDYLTQMNHLTYYLMYVQDSHSAVYKGEEERNGFLTDHLILEPESELSMVRDFEIWVDKESNAIIKAIVQTGDKQTEMEYSKIDFSPQFDENTFNMDLPAEVKIEKVEQ